MLAAGRRVMAWVKCVEKDMDKARPEMFALVSHRPGVSARGGGWGLGEVVLNLAG